MGIVQHQYYRRVQAWTLPGCNSEREQLSGAKQPERWPIMFTCGHVLRCRLCRTLPRRFGSIMNPRRQQPEAFWRRQL